MPTHKIAEEGDKVDKAFRKKLVILPLFMLFVLSILSGLSVNTLKVSAVEYPAIMVVPDSVISETLTPGENFTISIYTNYTGNDIWGYEFTLAYDPSILKGVEVTNGGLIYTTTLFVSAGFDNDVGKLGLTGNAFLFFKLPAPLTSGPGILANVTFKVVGYGTSDITIAPLEQYTDSWTGDGLTESFDTTKKPFVSDSEEVYVNETLKTKPTDYTINYETGNITFTTAPGEGAEVKAIYSYRETKLKGVTNGGYGSKYNIIDATTMPDQICHGYFDNRGAQEVHDVAVDEVIADPNQTIAGKSVKISAKLRNQGTEEESFNVTFSYDNEVIDKIFVTLVNGTFETIELSWDTPPVTVNATYTITAEVPPLAGEVDTDDNKGTAEIKIVALHDVSVKDHLEAPTTALVGDLVTINATVENQGSFDENVTITVSYKGGIIYTKNLTVKALTTSDPIPFTWNTTDLDPDTYTIVAQVTIDPDEVEYDDNTDDCSIKLALGHDVRVKRISAPKTVTVGELVTIEVLVTNLGGYDETFEVEVTCDTSPNKSLSVTLVSGASEYIEFSWDTTGVAPGSYTITAKAILDGDVNPNNNLGTQSINVSPSGAIAGTVTDASTGDPIEGATVTANGYSATTEVEGHYIIVDVPPDDYTINASKPSYYNNSKPATVVAGETTTMNFALTPLPGAIAGTVTEASGEVIAGANVAANGTSATTDSSGAYVIPSLPLGTYEVIASATGYESASQTGIIVFAEKTTTVNFTLRVNSNITTSADPTTVTVGESTTISGSITPEHTGVTVTIQYRSAGGSWSELATVTTDDNSQYSYVWTPKTAGTYEVKASWLGDENTSSAESDVQRITVQEPSSSILWYLYIAAAGVAAIIMAAATVYFLKIRKPKHT